ncbi:hypothetical protein FRC06_001722, partial [Ceratobasidium sp. 370]
MAFPLSSSLNAAEVLNAFDYFLNSAIADAKGQGLIPYGSSSNEPRVIITGSALCLYNAAVRSDTGLPSVLLPHFAHFGGIPKRLQYNTCPDPFVGLFQRWAEIVPRIQGLSEQQRADLENVICNGPPVPLLPEIYSPAPHLSYTYHPVHRIAKVLRVLAQDISNCRNFRARHDGHFMPNINTSFTNQSWTPPMQESPYSATHTPLQHPFPQTQPSYFPDWPQRASPPAAYEPPPSAESTASFSPTLFPGSTNEQEIFVSGFAPQRGATAPGHIFRDPRIPFPSPQPFNAPTYPPVDDPYRWNTVANVDYGAPGPYNTSSSTDSTATVIDSHTSILEIITQLGLHGCPNLTGSIDRSSFSSRPIARDGFGEVYRGRLWDGTQVAIKTIRTHEEYEESKHLKDSARELRTWSKCNHPNVARLMGLAEFNDQIAMVSPWMENGHLRNYVNKNPTVDRLELCTQIANGLAYLHSIGIVHGDLNGPNVLLSRTGDPILIDFGNSTQSEFTLQFTKTVTKVNMTMRWTAPEIFHGDKLSPEADVYALGMTILEAFTGKVPYLGKSDPAVMKAVVNDRQLPDRPPEIPEGSRWADMLWDLLINCCEDLSGTLDISTCSLLPIVVGGRFSLYFGELDDRSRVAVRVIDEVPRIEEPSHLEPVARELHAWSKCNHPNVVHLLGLANLNEQVALLSFRTENGDLQGYIKKYCDADRYKLSAQVANGLAYLHSVGIIHGDIKASAVFISGEGAAMLTGFEGAFAKGTKSRGTQTRLDLHLSTRWMAPELLQEDGEISVEADVYALGMTILETFTGEVPYADCQTGVAVIMAVVGSGRIPDRPQKEIPPDDERGDRLWTLLTECWHREPNKRPTAERIYKIPNVRGGNGEIYRGALKTDRLVALKCMAFCMGSGQSEWEHLEVHGDVKAANVLISDDGVAMLADFGSAILKLSTLKFAGVNTEGMISVRWAAPEALAESKCSTQADVYALGMTIL